MYGPYHYVNLRYFFSQKDQSGGVTTQQQCRQHSTLEAIGVMSLMFRLCVLCFVLVVVVHQYNLIECANWAVRS